MVAPVDGVGELVLLSVPEREAGGLRLCGGELLPAGAVGGGDGARRLCVLLCERIHGSVVEALTREVEHGVVDHAGREFREVRVGARAGARRACDHFWGFGATDAAVAAAVVGARAGVARGSETRHARHAAEHRREQREETARVVTARIRVLGKARDKLHLKLGLRGLLRWRGDVTRRKLDFLRQSEGRLERSAGALGHGALVVARRLF